MNIEVAILAGGMGTRLKSRTGNIPKPMALLLGKPVLEYQIEQCKLNGFKKIALLVHYENQIIKDYFNYGEKWGVNITYIEEKEPRGTAGALCDALEYMSDEFFVLYGDTFIDVNLNLFKKFHQQKKADISLILHPNSHPIDSDLVEIDENNLVTQIHPYPHPKDEYFPNLVNAALYIINKNAIKGTIPLSGKVDLAKNTFPELISRNKFIYGYVTQEYIKDMGTPDRIDKVELEISQGIPHILSTRQRRKAIFLDRDGTINLEVNRIVNSSQLILIPDSAIAIKKINQNGYLSVIITNQPVVARGEITHDELKKIHNKLEFELGKEGAYIDKLYYCPHHPEKGFTGEIQSLKINCECRKPGIALIQKAVEELSINIEDSWFIGDTTTDILAGQNAGLNTILVRTGYAGYDKKYNVLPNYIFPNLNKAIDFIFNKYDLLKNSLLKIPQNYFNTKLILIGGASRSGKSTTAQVLSEILYKSGKKNHIISLDGWLLPLELRFEGNGVFNRYNMDEVRKVVNNILESNFNEVVHLPIYDRLNRTCNDFYSISIKQHDCIILEGVTALMDNYLCSKSNLRIYVENDDEEREQRVVDEYSWRNMNEQSIKQILLNRNLDEVPFIKDSAINSNFRIVNNCLQF
jgi:histidinol-phosphate phosphatase family protein